jgi:aminomethyltransferase
MEPTMKEPYAFTFYTASWYRRSPYWQRTVEAGCTSWDLYNHMLIPTLYDDDEAEYRHLLEHVTVWDVAVERQLEVTGPDAARFAQLLTCRDLSRCEVLQCKYAPIIAPTGGIVNDPVLLRLAEDHFWFSLADSDAMLFALGVQAFAGLDVTIREPDVSPLQVQGPKSRDLVRDLLGEEVAGLRYYRCWEGDLDGIPLVVSRTGWTGEIGYELYLRDGSRGIELWDRVMSAGEPYRIRPIAPSDQRRLEAGIFNYGNDMTVVDTPFHVTGMERLVELEADFIGRDALRRLAVEGVDRKLVGVIIGGEPFRMWLEDFWPVRSQGEVVGRLTSASRSFRLGKNIGYAWVPIGLAEPGTELEIVSPDGPVPAVTATLPFIDPAKEIPKA